MLYMEDYLELIENLPEETRDKLAEVRELDLQVENAKMIVDQKMENLFSDQCPLNEEEKQKEHEAITEMFQQIGKDSDEKVKITGGMVKNMKRLMHRLDSDLARFKMELEADNSGITTIIENRVRNKIDMSGSSESSDSSDDSDISDSSDDTDTSETDTCDELKELGPDSSPEYDSGNVKMMRDSLKETKSTVMSYLQLGSSVVHPESSATIAAAASQALVATQHMQHGRMTASFKASLEAINNSPGPSAPIPPDMSALNPELADAAKTALVASRKKQKKRTSSRFSSHKSSPGFSAVDPEHSEMQATSSGGKVYPHGGKTHARGGKVHPNSGKMHSDGGKVRRHTRVGKGKEGRSGEGDAGSGENDGKVDEDVEKLHSGGGKTYPGGGKEYPGDGKAYPGGGKIHPEGQYAEGGKGGGKDNSEVGKGFPEGGKGHPKGGKAGHEGGKDLLQEGASGVQSDERYCICNEVAYGDMVACDNPGCQYEWYHYSCVDIVDPPKGKWFCPMCKNSIPQKKKKRRSRR